MTNRPNAPLVYTLGVVRFPRIPKVVRFADEFHDLIRHVYPVFDEIPLQVKTVKVGPDNEVDVQNVDASMMQFATHDRTWGVLLTEEVVALHTNSYVDHGNFIERFQFGLRALLSVPDIAIEWMEAVGLRYIDLVVPRDGERLVEYLNEWVLPPDAPNMKFREGVSVATYDTSVGGVMRFASLRNPQSTLPPDLETPIVNLNNWRRPRPETDFVVMDMDHGHQFTPSVKIDVDMVGKTLSDLRSVSKTLFESTGKKHAMKIWRGES
jgi:uncharacterized protein (TIGR04255 family)